MRDSASVGHPVKPDIISLNAYPTNQKPYDAIEWNFAALTPSDFRRERPAVSIRHPVAATQ
jgi:hypothetical protein